MTFFRRCILVGARRTWIPARFLGSRLIRADRRVRRLERDVLTRVIWFVTQDRVHRVKRWDRRSTVSVEATRARNDAWTRITRADGAAERFVGRCSRAWSIRARSRAMRGCVGSAWSGLTCGVIAEKLRRPYGAVRDRRRSRVRMESRRGLVRSLVRLRVDVNMIVEYTLARKGVIRWIRRFRIVRSLRTWSLTVLVGRHPWLRSRATNREHHARTRFRTATSPARRYFPADIPVQHHVTPALVLRASFESN